MARTVQIDPDELAYKAMRVLDEYFDTPAKSRDVEMARAARVASSYVASWVTLRQTENNAEALRLSLAKALAEDETGKFTRAISGRNGQRALPSGGRR